MTTAMATTISRRGWLSRLLMAAVAAPAMGATLAAPVHAGRKRKKKRKTVSVADRTEAQEVVCESGGGKLAVLDGPNGGNTTECKGGEDDGATCINTKTGTRCWQARTDPPTKPVGGGAVPPSGGNEDPTDGGGNNVSGGAHVPPSGGIDETGGGSGPVLE